MKLWLFRRTLPLSLLAASALGVAGACGPAEQPTPTATPARIPTPTAVVAPTPTSAPVVAVATPTPTRTPTPTPVGVQIKRGGTLRFRIEGDVRNMDSLLSTAGGEQAVMTILYENPVRSTRDLGLEPWLAKSWEVSTDGKALTLRLQTGVKFHDGTPFNAAALKFHFDRALDPKVGSIQAPLLQQVEAAEVVDDSTLRLRLKNPDATVLGVLADRGGMISSPTAVRATAKEEYTRRPVGSGIFKIKDRVSDSHITYERFPSYWQQGLPYLDQVTARIISDPSVATAAFRSGGIENFVVPQATDLPVLEKTQGVNLSGLPWPGFWYFAVNPTVKPFGDPRVRKAISMAIDRNALMQVAYGGRATPLYGPIPPAFGWAYDPAFKKYDYNLAEAKRLLAEAGYPNGFTVSPVVWFGGAERKSVIEAIAAMLGQVGIKLDLLLVQSAVASKGYLVDWQYPAYYSGVGPRPELHVIMAEHFHPDSPKTVGGPAIVPAGLREALDKAAQTYDSKERGALYRKAQDIIVEDMMRIFLYSQTEYEATWAYVKGYTSHPSALRNFAQTWLDR
ncbi:MAG: hypothetical protein HY535_02365 [Chloroflexi bacterium]|nr:hypothetical protein [Chloroflexota bacterium]